MIFAMPAAPFKSFITIGILLRLVSVITGKYIANMSLSQISELFSSILDYRLLFDSSLAWVIALKVEF